MFRDFLNAGVMNQAAAGNHNLTNLGQVFPLLNKGLPHHGVGFLDGAGVAAHRLLHRKGRQSKVQRLQLALSVGNLVGVDFQIRNQLLNSLR